MKKISKKSLLAVVSVIVVLAIGRSVYQNVGRYKREVKVLKAVVSRLEADSRVAEILVTGVDFNEEDRKNYTRIKFLEYDSQGKPLQPKYFTFSGNIIQFQSLVIRFHDDFVRKGDALKGKSAFLFWKVFMLDGPNTKEYEITPVNSIPNGYKVENLNSAYEQELWQRFWDYALNSKDKKNSGIKNAQIEAPGTMFIPGILYTIKIEHDGGLRIDSTPISPILKGEKI